MARAFIHTEVSRAALRRGETPGVTTSMTARNSHDRERGRRRRIRAVQEPYAEQTSFSGGKRRNTRKTPRPPDSAARAVRYVRAWGWGGIVYTYTPLTWCCARGRTANPLADGRVTRRVVARLVRCGARAIAGTTMTLFGDGD